MSEAAHAEPVMTSMQFNKKIMNWYRKAMRKLLELRDRGSHLLGESTAQKVYDDMMESFGGYTKVFDGAVDPVCVATMLHKSCILLSLLPEPKERFLLHKEFIAELLSKAGQMMPEMSDHHAASVLQFYSVSYPEILHLNLTSITHEELVQKSVDLILEHLATANSRTLVWGLEGIAAAKRDDKESCKAMLRALKGKANEADPDIISGVASVMGSMGLEDDEGVLAEYLGVLHDQIEKFRPDSVGDLIWGLAKMEHMDGRAFYSRLLTQYRMRMSLALPDDMTRLVDGLSIAKYQEDMDVLNDLLEVAGKHARFFNQENTAVFKEGLQSLDVGVPQGYWSEFEYA